MLPAPFILKAFFKRHALKLVGVAIILALMGGCYFMYKQNIKLQAEKYNLEATVEEKRRQLNDVIEQAEHMARINHELTEKERKLNESLYALTHKFNKNGRDFEHLAREKPGLVGPILNRATQETMDCIELITMGKECEE